MFRAGLLFYNYIKKIIPSMLLQGELIETAKKALHQIYEGWK